MIENNTFLNFSWLEGCGIIIFWIFIISSSILGMKWLVQEKTGKGSDPEAKIDKIKTGKSD